MTLSIFSNETFIHSLEIFFWMLGAFIIGLVFGRIFFNKKPQNNLDFKNNEYDDLSLHENNSQIRATKTFERGGIEMIKTVPEIKEIKKDDLKQINGIGATLEKKLNEIGIYNFSQISNLNKEDIEAISEKIKTFPGRIKRDNWVEQAQDFLKEIT